jgi:hypothetical protein
MWQFVPLVRGHPLAIQSRPTFKTVAASMIRSLECVRTNEHEILPIRTEP